MKKIKLGIIFGGNSSEYPVSLHSTGSVLAHIDTQRYDITLIGISPKGVWYVYDGDAETLEHDRWLEHDSTRRCLLSPSTKEGLLVCDKDGYDTIALDCILPILHGKNGEDGTLQGLFELAQIPYVGCDHVSSAIAMDKEYTHIICEALGIQMAPYIALRKSDAISFEEIQKQVEQTLDFPIFVKPANAGSSFGIRKVEAFSQLPDAIDFAFQYDDKVIMETGIDGFEVGCAVLGNKELTVGEIDEIDTHNSFFDYEAKYALANTQIICPARVDKATEVAVKDIAKRIYRILDCKGLARVDMFIGKDQQLYFNEINTLPGFTAASRYPSMLAQVGIDFSALLDRLIALAME